MPSQHVWLQCSAIRHLKILFRINWSFTLLLYSFCSSADYSCFSDWLIFFYQNLGWAAQHGVQLGCFATAFMHVALVLYLQLCDVHVYVCVWMHVHACVCVCVYIKSEIVMLVLQKQKYVSFLHDVYVCVHIQFHWCNHRLPNWVDQHWNNCQGKTV